MKQRANRRDFLKAAAATAVAGPYLIPGSALGAGDRPPPSKRIVMAGIGIGNRVPATKGRSSAARRAVRGRLRRARRRHRNAARDRVNGRYNNNDCKAYNDFRELLARNDIDAVHCATPDHWHALVVIEACRHGKDVYCQKPETRTLREGPLMVAAARRYGRVVSGGSQRVLEDYRGTVNQVLERRNGHDQVDQRQRRPALAALQPARPAGARGHGLGHVAGPGPLGPLPSLPLQRQLQHQRHLLAVVVRLFRRRHDRLGRAPLRRRGLRRRLSRAGARGSHLSQRKRQGVPDLPLSQRHPAVSQPSGHGQPAGRGHAGREAGRQDRARPTRAAAASTAISSSASRPARSPSATSSWPRTPSPCATWAASPTN